jgi:hypothetical protein
MTSTTTFARRRWYQFSLASILLLMAGVAVVLAPKVNQVRRQRQAAELVKRLGGTVDYNYRNSKMLPARLRNWLGDDFFAPVFRVDLSHTKIDDSQLANVCRWLPHLWALSLSDTACDDKSLVLVGELRELEHLELASTSVSDAGLQSVERLESLLFLDLHDTQVSDGAIPLLNRLPSLTTVNLQGTRVSDEGVKQCRAFATLEGPPRKADAALFEQLPGGMERSVIGAAYGRSQVRLLLAIGKLDGKGDEVCRIHQRASINNRKKPAHCGAMDTMRPCQSSSRATISSTLPVAST